MSFAHGLRPEFRFPNGLYVNKQLCDDAYLSGKQADGDLCIEVLFTQHFCSSYMYYTWWFQCFNVLPTESFLF